MDNRLKISKEKKQKMIKSIQNYFLNERNEDLGDLASSLIFDFFVEELAPEFYNQGVYDSYKFLENKMEDLFSIQIYKR
ncbi:DUF2164 domain-containing protein [Brassicibacter mesophilus]|jgi:uncharacterized protein (DUF2164 family)|uniref:DUF2164 domain-containing protein n=1 Tax=Brassicibacter mesophilus TaxID=745119 RepID=UPI003D1A1C30